MTLPGLALLLGGISLLSGLLVLQPVAIVSGVVVVLVAYREGRLP
jgi:hypothetical protein